MKTLLTFVLAVVAGVALAQPLYILHRSLEMSLTENCVWTDSLSDATSNVFALGTRGASFSNPWGTALTVRKFSSASNPTWVRNYMPGGEVRAGGLVRNASTGELYGCGYRRLSANGDGVVFKLDANGNVLWVHSFAIGFEGECNDITLLPNGDVVVVGSKFEGGVRSVFVRQVSSTGSLVALRTYSHAQQEGANGFYVEYGDNAVFVGGVSGARVLWLKYTCPGLMLTGSTEYLPVGFANRGTLGRGSFALHPATREMFFACGVRDAVDFEVAHVARMSSTGAVTAFHTESPHFPGAQSSYQQCRVDGSSVWVSGAVSFAPESPSYREGVVQRFDAALTAANYAYHAGGTYDPETMAGLGSFIYGLAASGGRAAWGYNDDNALVGVNLYDPANSDLYYLDLYNLGSSPSPLPALTPSGSLVVLDRILYQKWFRGVKSLNHTSTVVGGTPFSLRIELHDPSYNQSVRMVDDNTAVSTPTLTPFGPGVRVVNRTIATLPVGAPTPVTIRANVDTGSWSYFGEVTSTIVVVPPPQLGSLNASPMTAYAGSTINCNVTSFYRNGPTPMVVNLSDTSTLLTTPATAAIPAGGSFANFTVAVGNVTTSTAKQIMAEYMGTTRSVTVVLRPGIASLSAPTNVTGGTTNSATVFLTGFAGGAGQPVSLLSSGPELSVPASTSVPAGTNFRTFSFTTMIVTSSVVITITGKVGGVSKTATITVNP